MKKHGFFVSFFFLLSLPLYPALPSPQVVSDAAANQAVTSLASWYGSIFNDNNKSMMQPVFDHLNSITPAHAINYKNLFRELVDMQQVEIEFLNQHDINMMNASAAIAAKHNQLRTTYRVALSPYLLTDDDKTQSVCHLENIFTIIKSKYLEAVEKNLNKTLLQLQAIRAKFDKYCTRTQKLLPTQEQINAARQQEITLNEQ